MATIIRKRTSEKKKVRFKHKARIRSSVVGTPERPRFLVFRSNQHIYAQLVDDIKGRTLASASSMESDFSAKGKSSIEGAKAVGSLLAKRAIAKKVSTVCFDRGGYVYHGRVRAVADAAREEGLKF